MPKRRRIDEDALTDLIRDREGVVHVRDLTRAGVPASTVGYRTRAKGPWQRVLPAVILTCSGEPTWRQRLLAAAAYAGPGAVLTGCAALKLGGMGCLTNTDDVHLLVPHRRRRASTSYVTIERTKRLPAHTWISRLPCAPFARAVIDATRRMSQTDTVRAVISGAVQRGLCTGSDLVDELCNAQRRGTRLPRLVLGEVLAGAHSVAEAQARSLLQRADVPPPLWNHDLFAGGDWICRPDAIWHELGVVLEIDSLAWHLSPASYRATQARHRRMTKLGLLVIHVAPTDLRQRPTQVVAEIRETLEWAAGRPAPAVEVRPSDDDIQDRAVA
jgi:hypothetical protein